MDTTEEKRPVREIGQDELRQAGGGTSISGAQIRVPIKVKHNV